jgi:hypothetical protein
MDFGLHMIVSLRTGSDILLHLGTSPHFNDGFVHQSIFLELLNIFPSHVIIFFQLFEQVFVLLLCFFKELGFFQGVQSAAMAAVRSGVGTIACSSEIHREILCR